MFMETFMCKHIATQQVHCINKRFGKLCSKFCMIKIKGINLVAEIENTYPSYIDCFCGTKSILGAARTERVLFNSVKII